MNRQLYVHTEKTQNDDGTWNLRIALIDMIPIEQPHGISYRKQLLFERFETSQDEPQIEGKDFT